MIGKNKLCYIKNKIRDLLIRLNRDVFAGIWQVALIMPLDNVFFLTFTNDDPSYMNLDHRFWFWFAIGTIFFLGGYAYAPYGRKHKIIELLNRLTASGEITQLQKNKVWNIIKNSPRYVPLWTKDGFLVFAMENLYCMMIMFSFFAGEGLINGFMDDCQGKKIVASCHLILCFGCLWLEGRLDRYLANKMRKAIKSKNEKMFYGANKQITTQLIADITGDSTSDNLMKIHFENMLEDITDILDVSNDKKITKKPTIVKGGKTGLPKGRLEKTKLGVFQSKKDKKKNKQNKVAKTIEKKRKEKNKNKNKRKKSAKRTKKVR